MLKDEPPAAPKTPKPEPKAKECIKEVLEKAPEDPAMKNIRQIGSVWEHKHDDMDWHPMSIPHPVAVAAPVTEVAEEHIKLDANPPLAGKDLIFDIELVKIAA